MAIDVDMVIQPIHIAQVIHIFMAYLIFNFFHMMRILLSINLIQTIMLAFFFLIHLIHSMKRHKLISVNSYSNGYALKTVD